MNQETCSATFLQARLRGLLADNNIPGILSNFLQEYVLVDGGYGFLAYATNDTYTLSCEHQDAVLFTWDFDSCKGWDVVPGVQIM